MVGGHATVGRLSNNVFGRFKQLGKILIKSLNGHATVVGGHATVDGLSNNFCSTFQANQKLFEKIVERSRNSCGRFTRPAADCQALSVLLLPNRQNIAPVCV